MQRLNFNIRLVGRLVLRYTAVWIADSVSIAITALLLPGIYFLREASYWYLNPFVVALGFGLLNALVRPVLIILLLPITFVTLGLATLLLNSGLFYLMHVIVPGFVIESFGAAVVGLLVLTVVNTLLGNFLQLGDDYSFYRVMMKRFSTLTRFKEVDTHDRGIVVIQIDGLSYSTLKRALKRGKMPYLSAMLGERRYAIRKWFSGLPSQTSAVQAGIFYGNSYDIPGFRWFDKDKNARVESSNASDLSLMDERIGSRTSPLLKDGTSVNTLIHGSAKKKLMTVSALSDKDLKQHRGELEDFAIFSLHPYLYTRTILLMVWDFLVDRFQAGMDLIKRKKPRLRRGIKFSLSRAIGNTGFRELTSYFVREDIVRGAPIIYANYLGYDMVAHYAGPNAWDALSTLTGIDRQIKQIHRTIRKDAPKQFDLVILSDHGQTQSIPFKNLYGKTLSELIHDKLERKHVTRADRSAEIGYLSTLLREIRMVEEAYGTKPIRRSLKTLERLHARMTPEEPTAKHEETVIVCPSGNLAHVYFTESPARLTTEDVLEKYASLVEFLVGHPGIGFVMTTNRAGENLVMAKKGMRNLATGEIEGTDPIARFTTDLTRENILAALSSLGQFPHSGDLIINGNLHKRTSVVTFEQQRGTHGGLGGDQTAPFIIYPRRLRAKQDHVDTPIELHRFLKRLLLAKPERELAPKKVG